MENVVAGLDIGTSAIKIILYSKNSGTIYIAKENIQNYASDLSKIDPDKVVDTTYRLIAEAVARNKCVNIKAIGLSSIFPTIMAVDQSGIPLTYISTWADNHAKEVVARIRNNSTIAEMIPTATGCVLHESYPLWKIIWLKENQGELFKRTGKFISLSEYLTYKMTGKFLISRSIASTTSLYNVHYNKWDSWLLRWTGIDEARLSSIRDAGYSEPMLESVCSRIGIDRFTSLTLGIGDGLSCHLATGCLDDMIMSSTIGTTGALRITVPSPKTNNPHLWCYYLDEGKYVLGSAINAGGCTLKWFSENIICNKTDILQAMDATTETGNIGGPLVLPFFHDERGPSYSQNRHGMIVGLSANDNQAILHKSMLEGILFNLYSCYEILIKETGKPVEIRASGGYTNSSTMLQMQADIFNREINVPTSNEAGALGAATIALKAIGEIKSLEELKIGIEKKVSPCQQRHEQYMKRYEQYKAIYYQTK